MVTYDTVEKGIADIFPRSIGWQPIGRGDYLFSELVKKHGAAVFENPTIAPPHFQEVSDQRFIALKEYHQFPLIATTYRVIEYDCDGVAFTHPVNGHLFINSLGFGFMICHDLYMRKTRYFTFAFCDHDFKFSAKRYDHVEYVCQRCNCTLKK